MVVECLIITQKNLTRSVAKNVRWLQSFHFKKQNEDIDISFQMNRANRLNFSKPIQVGTFLGDVILKGDIDNIFISI